MGIFEILSFGHEDGNNKWKGRGVGRGMPKASLRQKIKNLWTILFCACIYMAFTLGNSTDLVLQRVISDKFSNYNLGNYNF